MAVLLKKEQPIGGPALEIPQPPHIGSAPDTEKSEFWMIREKNAETLFLNFHFSDKLTNEADGQIRKGLLAETGRLLRSGMLVGFRDKSTHPSCQFGQHSLPKHAWQEG